MFDFVTFAIQIYGWRKIKNFAFLEWNFFPRKTMCFNEKKTGWLRPGTKLLLLLSTPTARSHTHSLT